MACAVWLARDFLRTAGRPIDIPPCGCSADLCPPITEGAPMTTSTYDLLDIPLASRTGTSTLPTRTYGEIIAPGLAITPGLWGDDSPRFNGGWNVTHVGSGTLISGGHNLHCLACTRDYAQAAIDSGIDWTLPQPEVTAIIAARGERVEALLAALRELRTCLGTECDRGFVFGDPGL